MQQTFRRKPMPKFAFNKNAKEPLEGCFWDWDLSLRWIHSRPIVFINSKFDRTPSVAVFRNATNKINTSELLIYVLFISASSWTTIEFYQHTVPMTISNHLFQFLIGKYSVAEIWHFIKKRNENNRIKNYQENKCKYKVAFFTVNSPH